MKTNIFATLFVIFVRSYSTAGECVLDVHQANAPLVITDRFTFPVPSSDHKYHFPAASFFYIQCPKGTRNNHVSNEGDRVICMSGTRILNTRTMETLDFSSLTCKNTEFSISKVRKLDQKCVDNFTLYEVGIGVGAENIAPLITVCFDDTKQTPFYVQHKNIAFNCNGSLCPTPTYPFIDSGNIYRSDVDELYLYSSEIFVDINPSIGRLVNPGVYMDPIQQYATFEYITTYPVYYGMEEVFSKQTREIVGTLDVLHVGNPPTEFYLGDCTIPFPKWVWSVDYSESLATDGVFYFVYGLRSSDAETSWKTEICSEGSIQVNLNTGGRQGSCSVDALIHPQLKKFVQFITTVDRN